MDANIKAAANNLVRAASTKREKQKQLLAEADNVKREYDKLEREKKHEIHRNELSAAVHSDSTTIASIDLAQIHHSKKEISKAHENAKHKIADLQSEAQRMVEEVNFLEQEAHKLEKKA